VSYGGLRPDTCNTTLTPGFWNGGDWPCFPSGLQTRVVRVFTGPDRWSYLTQLDRNLVFCFIFLALNLVLMAGLIWVLRKPRFWPEHGSETCGSCGHTDTVGQGDCEKGLEELL
jgi:hypothetical protein